MKTLYGYFLVLIVLFLQACSTDNQDDGQSAPMAAFDQELLKIKDPATGVVPSGALYKALIQLKNDEEHPVLQKKEVYPFGWHAVNDFFATLAISKIDYDKQNPRIMYFATGEGWYNADAGRGAGVWKTNNGGKFWYQLASSNNSVFYYCQDLGVHPQTGDIYVSTRTGGLQRSQDGGQSWQKVLGKNAGAKVDRAADIEFTADGGIMVSFGVFNTDGIYYSDNGDSGTWDYRMNGFPTKIYRIELATAPSNANRVYAIPVSSISSDNRKITGIYRSDDKGLNWYEVNNPNDDRNFAKTQGWYDLTIAVDPEDDDHVVIGGLHLWRSYDGGIHWEQLSQGNRTKNSPSYVHVDQHEIVFISSDTILFGNDGGIYKCDNFRSENPFIYDLNNTYNVTQFYACDIHPGFGSSFIIGGTQDNGSIGSSDYQLSDFRILSGADGAFCAINHKDGDIFYTSTQYNRIYRNNHGIMDTLTNPGPDKTSYQFINPLAMDPNNPDILYQPCTEGTFRLKNASTATKNDWEQAVRGWGKISAISVSKNPANVLFQGRSTGTIYRIIDAHQSDENTKPTEISRGIGLTSVYTSNICVDPADANHLLVCYSNYGVASIWETQNALSDDVNWVSHEGDLPDIPVRWIVLHPDNSNAAYIATELGVFYTDKLDGAQTHWEPSNKGLAFVRVDMLKYRESDRTLLAATHGRGLFTAFIPTQGMELSWTERGPKNIGGRTRSILPDPNDPTHKKLWAASVSGGLWGIENVDEISIKTELDVPHADLSLVNNPVSFATRIVYYLPDKSKIKITLYDLQGRLIQTILETESDKGVHYKTWTPAQLRPGIYLLNLSIAGQHIDTERVVVL